MSGTRANHITSPDTNIFNTSDNYETIILVYI